MTEQIPLGKFEDQTSSNQSGRRDAIANREHILHVAEKLFATAGVAEVNMADIATAAAVGKGTLYRNFANKGELCFALMDEQLAEFQDQMLGRMRQLSAQHISALEQLDQFLDSLVYFTAAHAPLLCEVQRANTRTGADLDWPYYWQRLTLTGLLQTAVTAGELPADLDISYFTDAIISLFNAQLFRFQRETRGYTLERISAGIRRLVAGLKESQAI